MALYTDDLVATVQRDSFLTTAQSNFTPDQLLAIAYNHLQATVMPLLLSEREGWFREYVDVPFVSGQADYQLPTYAMYGKLESVQYLSASSAQLRKDQLTRVEIENLGLVLPSTSTGTPCFFSVNSHAITVYPSPSAGIVDSMRIWYDRRPASLVLKAAAAQVLSINTGTGVVTYTAAPPATFGATTKQDFYNGQSPYQLKDQTVATALSGSTQTFALADAALLSANDWVSLKDQSVFLPIPEELMPYLADLVIASLARTQQDANLYQAQVQIIAGKAKSVLSATGNRLPGNGKKIRMTNPLVRNKSWSGFR